MSYLTLISYLVVFVVGVAFGKFVKFLDYQGTIQSGYQPTGEKSLGDPPSVGSCQQDD